jgi:glutathione S-transferase
MSDIILHHYDASPFTQKVLRMFGLKGLPWRSVLMPMLPPKPDLMALTGGYRGTPVMQIGADVYIDSQRIAMELERRYPQPSLFPDGGSGLALMLVKWSDAFFRSMLTLAVEQTATHWPAAFLADRKFLFHDFDWEGALAGSSHARSQFRAHAHLLERQLADGRMFMGGAAAGLADIQAHVFIAAARSTIPQLCAELLAGFAAVRRWDERMSGIGEGHRREWTAADALTIARNARAVTTPLIDPSDPLRLAAGTLVQVSPDDTRRGFVCGELVVLQADELALSRTDAACGEVVVHFPRLGYRVEPAPETAARPIG